MTSYERKLIAIRFKYQRKYGLSRRQAQCLTRDKLEQLEQCSTEEARKLLLGVSE